MAKKVKFTGKTKRAGRKAKVDTSFNFGANVGKKKRKGGFGGGS
jgi:hypothetical protein